MNVHKIAVGGFAMRFLTAFLCIMVLFCTSVSAEMKINARSAVLIDADSGRVLWERESEAPMAMASTTKIMTAIVALENSDIHTVTTVSKNAVAAPPVKLHLKAGEHITIEQLLYAMLLQSSNDAAVAVAEAVCGDVESFCRLMNKKAKELDCTDTVFETPNGLDKGEHHSTAYDMARISAYAIKNNEFIKISNTLNYSFSTDMGSYSVFNKDRLLTEYSGAIGIKTGFTGKAGHCFAGAAKRGDVTLVSVVLASGWGSTGKNKKWTDTKQILDYGFNNYKKCSIIHRNEKVGSIKVDKAKTESVEVAYAKDYEALISDKDRVEIKKNIEMKLTAPVTKGQRVGNAEVFINGERQCDIELITQQEAERIDIIYELNIILKEWISCIGG